MRNILFFLLLLSLLASCETQQQTVKNQARGSALGTTYAITYLSTTKIDVQKSIDSVFKAVNRSMSTYIPNSDISRINEGDTTIKVDHMFKEVFEISKEVHKASKGYFDPTIGVLANAWGFGPGKQIKLDDHKVDSLLQFVGFDKVQLNKQGFLIKQAPEIRLDFNAVAKGYAIDRLAKMLDNQGFSNYLVEVGGEVYAKGINTTNGNTWSVGIDDPTNLRERGSAAIIGLEDKALASSGNYRKFWIDEETGKKYVHTIDPKTGYTKNSKVLATSVIADNCATADAFATAFMAMDLEDTKLYLGNQQSIEAFIVYLNDNDIATLYMTKGFEALLKY